MIFKIMGREGDAVYDYDVPEIQVLKFDELINDGLLPVVHKDGNAEVIQSFDPDVSEIVWMPAIMGG